MSRIRPVIKVWFRTVIDHAAAVTDERKLCCIAAGIGGIVRASGTAVGFAAVQHRLSWGQSGHKCSLGHCTLCWQSFGSELRREVPTLRLKTSFEMVVLSLWSMSAMREKE